MKAQTRAVPSSVRFSRSASADLRRLGRLFKLNPGKLIEIAVDQLIARVAVDHQLLIVSTAAKKPAQVDGFVMTAAGGGQVFEGKATLYLRPVSPPPAGEPPPIEPTP